MSDFFGCFSQFCNKIFTSLILSLLLHLALFFSRLALFFSLLLFVLYSSLFFCFQFCTFYFILSFFLFKYQKLLLSSIFWQRFEVKASLTYVKFTFCARV